MTTDFYSTSIILYKASVNGAQSEISDHTPIVYIKSNSVDTFAHFWLRAILLNAKWSYISEAIN